MGSSVFLGGGGNPFDQDLNETDSPTFAGLTVDGEIDTAFTSTGTAEVGLTGIAHTMLVTLDTASNPVGNRILTWGELTTANDAINYSSTLGGANYGVLKFGSGTAVHVTGVAAGAAQEGSGNVTDVQGISTSAYSSGTGTVSVMSGITAAAGNFGAGDITDLVGLRLYDLGNFGAGDVTRARGIMITSPTNNGGGALATYQGLYMEAIAVGSVTSQAINYADLFTVNASGVVMAAGYQSSDGTAGVTAGPFTAITSIQVKNGLIVALTGT